MIRAGGPATDRRPVTIGDFPAGGFGSIYRLMTIETLIAAKGTVLLIWLALLFLGERLRAAAPWPKGGGLIPGWRRLRNNGALWVLNGLFSALLFVPITYFAASTGPEWRDAVDTLPPAWVLMAVDLLILDLFTYAWHRANHEWPVLWRFHQVHHFDRFLDSTSATRFHAGEVLISVGVRGVLVWALDIPFSTVVLFEGLLLLAAYFNHSNLRLPPRLEANLSKVIVTPSIHWVHHHAKRTDTDGNYASFLSVWDRLFGTKSPGERVMTMPIGLEGEAADPPLSRLLLAPFLPPRQREAGDPRDGRPEVQR